MKFDVSGVPKPAKERRPGTLLGKRVPCFRCGEEHPESDLKTVPPGARPGTPRIFVCTTCA